MMNKNPVNPVNLVILSLLVFVVQHTTFAQTVDKLIQREMSERRIPELRFRKSSSTSLLVITNLRLRHLIQ
jgi:hypothetical protein